MVAVGDDRVGLVGEAREQELAAVLDADPVGLVGVEDAGGVVAAGTGVDEETEAVHGQVGSGEGAEGPGVEEGLPGGVVELELVARGGLEPVHVEGPEEALGIAANSGCAAVAGAKDGGFRERTVEGGLEPDAVVVDGGGEVGEG